MYIILRVKSKPNYNLDVKKPESLSWILALVVILVIKHLNIGFLNAQCLITIVPNIFV